MGWQVVYRVIYNEFSELPSLTMQLRVRHFTVHVGFANRLRM